jgi:hypothetical protein
MRLEYKGTKIINLNFSTNWATLPLGEINTEVWSSAMGVGRGANNLPCKKRKLLRSLQEIQPDFVEEAKA